MKRNVILLIVLLILLNSLSFGCINRSSSRVVYTIDVTPSMDSETTLIIPLVIDNKSGDIDPLMNINPIFDEGEAYLEIIETNRGPALKIITSEVVEMRFIKYYDESGTELRANKKLSMTNISYDEKGESTIKSWVYVNSTTDQTTHFWFTLTAGDKDRINMLDIIAKNVSNGWHQIIVKEGYGIF